MWILVGIFAIAVPVLVKFSTCGRNSNFMYLILHGKIIVRRQDMMEEGFLIEVQFFRWIVAKAIRHGIKKYAEHTTNQTKANKQKHQKANARRQREQGGDKKRNKKGWKSRK